ncbi:M24 family metallopeptidase [Sphingomonas jatrophae]|uniref:Xaa-Pro dipeptidase n=1 Tax=Sphingomonas jatrophae TaxID=1166337 RepID=A0A1I6L0X8_9SPHN|nr:Xaa-Pro peptidase family protein [Sphingomonas jatrophae]SFR96948.1 Xaa-Pro dipeptidase [Sphingomonas jatrophae]
MDTHGRDTSLGRRAFLAGAGALGLGASVSLPAAAAPAGRMADRARPITPAERQARIRQAQRLMQQQGVSAIVTEPGASMEYFTGVRWRRSERPALAIIPREGNAALIVPKFEEGSIRETLLVPAEVRAWEEDQSPYAIAAGLIADRKLASGRIGTEETLRTFIVQGLTGALPSATIEPGTAIFRGCRMIKTPAEIALMQVAADITVAAYRATWPQVRAGMTPADIGAMMSRFTTAEGASVGFNLVLIGEASAYPHGSGKPQVVREGDVVLMDCGCNVHGYESDISRTFVVGSPGAQQRRVWDQVRRGQQIAFETAQVGVAAGAVDDAVRHFYDGLGYGPGYALPGLSHRTGHGIGMEGHEPVNFVRGERTPLALGMCFSNEPGLYLPGSFGVRLEDCIYITAQGPRWFSRPPASLDRPMG